jgi:hypothetical protein
MKDNQVTYTVNEFRTNLRKAFEQAEDMIDVFIERYDKTFCLITKDYLDELLKPDNEFIKVPNEDSYKLSKTTYPEIIKTPDQAKKVVDDLRPTGFISKSYSARKKK